ncbi:hypothetical protein JCM10914_569 [Paenibacillus sp. JCM 10914]|nr:hypothetical protein JCM10914_569 [Paenibacillus sp. JCM 10914]
MTVLTSQQAALHEKDKADTRTIHRSERFYGMYMTFEHGSHPFYIRNLSIKSKVTWSRGKYDG